MDMMKCVAQRSKRKYIDADVMINELRELRTKYLIRSVFGEDMRNNAVIAGTLEAVAQILDGLPAADVVEVVRCRECKHYHTGMFCEKWADLHPHAEEYPMVGSDGYCHYGEKE